MRTTPVKLDPWLELRVLRERDGHTLTSLAREAGISLSYLSDMENGRRWPNPRMTKKLADSLHVPYSVLVKPRSREEYDAA
ncbi:helix-turn-helix domain-containing protein [Zhihengliuella halotolerans]|uniref:helix-turn-helix domain-containing protein n=1 Tax=Zhihengliuella halotolerans TaxID=370736 RepID=UPI000C809865